MTLITDTVELTLHKKLTLETQCDDLARYHPKRVKSLALALAWIYRKARRAGMVDKEDYNRIMWGLVEACIDFDTTSKLTNGNMWKHFPCERHVVYAAWACASLTPSAYREIIHLIKTGKEN